MKKKICLVICWFGEFPSYINIWLKSCEYNSDFTFLIFTDSDIKYRLPPNVKMIPFSIEMFIDRANSVLKKKIHFNRPYRVCDFRPCFGMIFRNEISDYDFWGYCDIDVVFGKLNGFITENDLNEYDAIFNGGHFSLLRNVEKINRLYLKDGAAFDFDTVSTHDAVFAFDEITGIQSIARENKVKAKYMIPYIETEIRFTQLRSRLGAFNPAHQAFYWENGELYRVKCDAGEVLFQKQAYIHLQKRKLIVDINKGNIENSFWITPFGFETKKYLGKPTPEDIDKYNHYEGEYELKKQDIQYKFKKILAILKRTPFQIYVRLKQEKFGINRNQGTLEERLWEKY
ncbi:MAG: DUF6625 family protein [Lachnospiraceae bacterium]|nr:DUF6625 family protein [Lachnospiraceae bacterium]